MLFSVSIGACASVNRSESNVVNSYSVKVYKGLYLGGLLNEPEDIISTSNAREALDKAWYAGIAVKSNKGVTDEVIVKSCNDYFKAQSDNLEPVKEFERSAYFEFAVMCMAAKEIASSKSSSFSYLNSFKFNIETPKLFPKQFSFITSSLESKKILNDDKLVYWVDVVTASAIDKVTPESAVFKFSGSQQELSFVAKADFNRDGIEDLLIASKDSVVGGSYTAIRMFLITRLKQGGEYVLLKSYNY